MSDVAPAAAVRFPACPHCGHSHHNDEAVEMCGLFKAGWHFVDADGYLANGPHTRPDLGHPKQPMKLVKASCRSCFHASLSRDGALVCHHWGEKDELFRTMPILDALVHCTEARAAWHPRAPAPPLYLIQLSLFDQGTDG